MTSHPTQEEVDDILGAALDALDDLDGSNSDDEQDTGGTTDAAAAAPAAPVPQPSAATSAEASSSAGTDEPAQSSAQTQNTVYYGPEPPPATAASSSAKSSDAAAAAAAAATKKGEASSPSASLEDAMSQLLRAGEALQKSAGGGVGDADDIDLEGAEKMLDEIMGQLQLGGLGELMGGLEVEASNDGKSSSDDKSSKGTDKKADKKKNTVTKAKTDKAKSSETMESAASSAPKSNGNSNSTQADVDRAVQRLLSDMAKAGSDDDDAIPDLDALMNGGNMEAMGEEMMESMMKELSAFGASGADDVVDGMMRQLLSKELMYEPMKQVCDRFPAWLAESKAHLSEDEYQK